MRYILSSFIIAMFSLSGGCPTPRPTGLENMVLAMIIIGPVTISAAKGPVPYTVVIGSGGKPANVSFNPPAPLYLEESDGTLMAFTQSVNLPAGVNSQTLTLQLSCTGGMVGGGAFTVPYGQQNNPISSGGTSRPAIVAVRFQNVRFDGSSGDRIGNTVAITCTP